MVGEEEAAREVMHVVFYHVERVGVEEVVGVDVLAGFEGET